MILQVRTHCTIMGEFPIFHSVKHMKAIVINSSCQCDRDWFKNAGVVVVSGQQASVEDVLIGPTSTSRVFPRPFPSSLPSTLVLLLPLHHKQTLFICYPFIHTFCLLLPTILSITQTRLNTSLIFKIRVCSHFQLK
jgi:hypothetical protein